MNQRLVLLALLVLLMGTVVGSMAWLGGSDLALHPAATAVDPEVTDTARPAAAGPSRVVEASAPANATAVRDAAVEGANTTLPLPEDAQWIEVTVVDKVLGTPVPGASVHWFDNEHSDRVAQDAMSSQQRRNILEGDPERWGEQFGWHTTADSKGVAKVAIVDWATVVARSESRYGTLELQRNTLPPPGGHRLLLGPDLEALVQVLDDHGAPAPDVMIALSVHNGEGAFQQLWNWMPLALTTAPDGIARVRHLQTITASLAQLDEPEGKKVWRVRTLLPGHVDPGVPLSITEPPAQPIVLRLPPCGRVRVRAEFAGQPMHGMTSANVDDAEEQEPGGQQYGSENLADVDGWVRFPRVPLSHRYVASTNCFGNLRVNFAGPLVAGQEIAVVLLPNPDEILLRGRIVDEERRPVATQRFDLQARGPQFRAGCAFTTDATGGFLAVLGRARKDNRVEQLSFTLAQRDGVPKRADATPRDLRVGVEDLGELVLSRGTLLASGHFRSGGSPHKKPVHFWVERREQNPGDRSERWRRQGTLTHQAEDNFEVRGTLSPGTYRLGFQAENSLPIPPVPFAVGATDLTVDIRVGHALAASVLLGKDVPQSDLTAVLVPTDVAGKAKVPGENPDRSGGRFNAQPWCAEGERYNLQWNALAAGTYSLELRLWTQTKPLLVVPDVQVPPPAGGDPRLADIDLRQLVRVLLVKLLDSDGNALEGADGVIFPAGQPPHAEWLGYAIDGPSVRLLLAPGPIELIVAAEGHRPTPALATGDTLQVRLDAWPTITLTFGDMPTLPPRVSAVARLEPTETSQLPYRSQRNGGNREDLMRSRRVVTIEGGKATVPIGDGPHSLQLRLAGNRRSVEVAFPARQFLSTDGQAHVAVTVEQWQKAIEVVKQPPK